MYRVTSKKMHPAKRKVKFPTIGEDAAALGCSRQHLWFVLNGIRISKSLSARYRKLKGGAK